MERTPQCHCGSLRVIAAGERERVYVCHCRACQRRTGAVVHSDCAYPKAQVQIEGDNKIYEREADSGFHYGPFPRTRPQGYRRCSDRVTAMNGGCARSQPARYQFEQFKKAL
jgi:hypothetical protein